MTKIYDVDTTQVIDIVASSGGDLALAAERLNKQLEQPYGTITEYDLQTRVSQLDIQTADQLSGRLRTLLIVKLFNLIVTATDMMYGVLGDLKPADLAKTHSSLVNSFSSLTAPAAKVTFDFNGELEKLAAEFGLPVEDMKAELKTMEDKVRVKK